MCRPTDRALQTHTGLTSYTRFAELNHIKRSDPAIVYHNLHKRPLGLPSMIAGRSRIYMQQSEPRVGHHLEDMAVSAHKKIYTV